MAKFTPIIAMTGTRKGMTEVQKLTFGEQLILLKKLLEARYPVLHHGGADGADCQAHVIARSEGMHATVFVPQGREGLWHASPGVTVVNTYKDPLARNWDIIKGANVLLVVPETPLEQLRSGTWACYRYAKKSGIPRWIIEPSGNVRKET